MIPIIIILFFLSLLILVHELGHFIIAKKSGIKVEEFGIGFPPRIFSRKIGETVYSINLIPFGGFVRLYGEDEQKKSKKAFSSKGVWTRISVVVGGVFFNFIFALILFLIFPFLGYLSIKPQNPEFLKIADFKDKGVLILNVQENSPADKAGIKRGDIVIRVNKKSFSDINEFIDIVKANLGKEITFEIERKGKILYKKVIPRKQYKKNEGPTGISIAYVGYLKYKFPQGIKLAFLNFINAFRGIFYGLAQFFKILFVEKKVAGEVAGPVGIFSLGTNFYSYGMGSLLFFVAILSLNLGILNLLPFPALDGGRLIFLFIEAFTRKKVQPKYEAMLHKLGFLLLIILLLVITAKDIKNILK